MSWNWPLRSFLFVPAHRHSWVVKAIASGTDAVVLDLEDSVPPDQKAAARDNLGSAVSDLAAAGVAPFVRINAPPQTWAVELDAAVGPGLAGIILPKASTAEEMRRLDGLLSYREGLRGMPHGEVAIIPCPETARGLQDAELLVAATPRAKGVLGTISGPVTGDVAQAFGFQPSLEGVEQQYMNSKLVLDSRAGGGAFPLAGIFGVPLNDMTSLEALIRRAKAFGYTGCPVMHPSHVAVVNSVFTPTADDAEYFAGMLEAFAQGEAQGLGAVSYRGMMIDYAMLPHARQVMGEYHRRTAAIGRGKSLEN